MTLLVLLVVACVVVSVIAMAGAFLLLENNAGEDQTNLFLNSVPGGMVVLENWMIGRAPDGIGFGSR